MDRGAQARRARRRRPHLLHRRRRVGRARSRAERLDVPRSQLPLAVIEAVVFDLDGVLIQSEEVWDEVRGAYVRERGGRWDAEVQRTMMGMSSVEWSRYLHEVAGIPDDPDTINDEVVRRMLAAYKQRLPLIDGAVAAVQRLATRYRAGPAPAADPKLVDSL